MIKIAFVGDIMLSRCVGEFLLANPSHQIISKEIEQILSDADLCIGNLENPIAINSCPLKKTAFKANPDSLNQIEIFDIFSLANNHINDCGSEGALETIEYLKKKSFQIIGYEEDSPHFIKPLTIKVKEKNVSIFSCAIPALIINEKETDLLRVIDATDNKLFKSIENEKNKTDYIIILVHGGNEMISYPEPSFRDLCYKYIDYGADFVITTHPHVIGGNEKYKSKNIFYSLGDFIFDADSFLRRESVILKLKLNDHASWEYVPTTITDNFEVILADKKLSDKILLNINHVSSALLHIDYDKKYSGYYKKSLFRFQKDRIKYKLIKKGVLHSLRFLIKKISLVPFYFKIIIYKKFR